MALPAPRCECGHDYVRHLNGGPCQVYLRHNHDENTEDHEKCDRCSCGKFSVPRGSGRRPAQRGSTKTRAKAVPWWR